MSGIVCTPQCISEFETFKLQNHRPQTENRKYLIYRIKNDEIVLDSAGDESKTWDDFVDEISVGKEGSYSVFDFSTTLDDGRKLDKIVFINWAPDNLPVRQKMLYGATLESFKSNLTGIHLTIQASDISDIEYEKVLAKITNGR